jgi:hypothetical protein
MLLGDLLAYAERAGAKGDVSAALADLPLMARVAAAAGEAGLEPDEYVLAAVRLFERHASPDDWVSLMGAASGEPDSGRACLKRIVEWALRADSRHEMHS